MLKRLHIRNLAVLDEIELDFESGFTILTGETGAGKSMLVDALGLALGERADSKVIRTGARRMEISAIFEVPATSMAGVWLSERDFDALSECQIRRIVTDEGRSRAYINGQPVPLELLRELGGQLVEICGQHAHQSLVRRAAQRDLLDAHGAHEDLVARVIELHGGWAALNAEKRTLLESKRTRQSRRDLLSYQLRELEALNAQPGEFESLEQERSLLANVGRISAGLNIALERLYDAEDTSAHDGISAALREMQGLANLDGTIDAAANALGEARIHLGDAVDQIRQCASRLEHDPARQNAVESRLDSMFELARKHDVEPACLWQTIQAVEAELAALTDDEDRLATLDEKLDGLATQLRDAALELHVARTDAAASLTDAITANLHTLGMPDSRFSIRIEQASGDPGPGAGQDQIEFLISTAPGQPPGPIAKVASGGELSRLSLAIQVVAMTSHGAPTLIFDEVDAGIGGGVAEIVGKCLRTLSRSRQVLCVTHLPQVATQADHHFAVAKTTAGEATRATVRHLTARTRIDEVARMLGGVRITQRTRDHAKEMLTGAPPRRPAG